MATDITVTEDVTNVTVTESTTAIDISPQVTSVGVSAVDITAANVASSISLTPTGNISASNVQAAFNEIGANEDFTTALKDKLDGIEEGATADQTGAEIKTAYEAESDTNAFTDDEKSKLAGIESGANVTDTANVASSGAVMDSDFTSNGFMKRTGDGSYAVDTSTYLTDYTVTEADVRAHESAIEITESQITNLQSYLTAESDPVFLAHAASGVTSTKIDQWDTAYDWGDHELAGYLTSIANGSIDTDQLADDAVTAAKIADGVVIGTSGTQKIDDGTLEIALEKSNDEGYPEYNKPLLNLTTIDNRSSGKMLTFSEIEGAVTGSTAALGKEPYASYGSLFIGVSNCGLHMTSSFSNVIFPCNARGEHNNNTISLGSSSKTFKDIYATDTTINTSDRNKKQDITALSDAETNVAIACKGLLRKYKWKQSVEEKGSDARWHFGIIAQELETAFADQGLDASDYGVFIKEEIETDGVTETHYAVRYNELLAFMIAAI